MFNLMISKTKKLWVIFARLYTLIDGKACEKEGVTDIIKKVENKIKA